jgi:peptidoglycan/LPS O-acetylase OafA/YrhL
MRRFYELDSLRGIAAVSVVVLHYQFQFFDPANWVNENPFPKGYLAVDLFFILSGIVLAYRYGRGLSEGAVSIGQFMFARAARLYPLHFVTLIFVAATAVLFGTWGLTDHGGGPTPRYALLLNLLLMQCIGLLSGPTFDIVSWSISTEFVVNGFYAVIARHAKRWVLPLVLIAAFGALAILAAAPKLPLYLSVMYERAFGIPAGLLRCIFGFMIGVGFFRLLIATRMNERVSPLQATGIATAVIVAAHLISYVCGLSSYRGLDYVIVGVDFPALLFVAMVKGSPLNLLLRFPPLNFLGAISYSIYLVHMPVITLLTPLLPYTPSLLLTRPWAGFYILAATIVVSTATYLLIEQLGQRLMLRLAKRAQESAARTIIKPIAKPIPVTTGA